ncbi:hypothetical protein QWJ34_24990 [Saccharibacillus sp. CPCC 101409]|uniref:hypothetical protein n=1 Tax=Saccharibacillus sp. CPCC 101409 TaxID=3058041 RepID=UPI002673A0CA|nr:hypothetical protein [Saccharibacillus sp. CPCC 101409]MDO3413044.1 hypothetical protein [Saccharibacillus sp. CPCC 101409]
MNGRLFNRSIVIRIGSLCVLLTVLLSSTACSTLQHRSTIIDWIDFVKIGDDTYTGLWDGVLRDSDTVTDEAVGTVKKKLEGRVNSPNYRSRSGDAAFLEKGTKLYRVEGFEPEEAVAVRSDEQIGGYKLYVRDGFKELPSSQFGPITETKLASAAIYRIGETQPLRELSGDELERFVKLLRSGTDASDYAWNSPNDPQYYSVVFDTGEPILYTLPIWDDGKKVIFQETRELEAEVRELLAP